MISALKFVLSNHAQVFSEEIRVSFNEKNAKYLGFNHFRTFCSVFMVFRQIVRIATLFFSTRTFITIVDIV